LSTNLRGGGASSSVAAYFSGALNDLTDELLVAFRHLDSTGVLNGVPNRGGRDTYQFETNGFTARFVRFVLDPF